MHHRIFKSLVLSDFDVAALSRDRFNSILYPSHGDGIRLKGNKLRVQHVGTIRVCLHREVEGNIKTLSLKREADKWFLVVTEKNRESPLLQGWDESSVAFLFCNIAFNGCVGNVSCG
jgi:hypothetical protein